MKREKGSFSYAVSRRALSLFLSLLMIFALFPAGMLQTGATSTTYPWRVIIVKANGMLAGDGGVLYADAVTNSASQAYSDAGASYGYSNWIASVGRCEYNYSSMSRGGEKVSGWPIYLFMQGKTYTDTSGYYFFNQARANTTTISGNYFDYGANEAPDLQNGSGTGTGTASSSADDVIVISNGTLNLINMNVYPTASSNTNAIYSTGGTVNLENCVLSTNGATGGTGSLLHLNNANAKVGYVRNTTVKNDRTNTSSSDCSSGIYLTNGAITTIDGNTSVTCAKGDALWVKAGTLGTIDSTGTFTGGTNGNGLYISGGTITEIKNGTFTSTGVNSGVNIASGGTVNTISGGTFDGLALSGTLGTITGGTFQFTNTNKSGTYSTISGKIASGKVAQLTDTTGNGKFVVVDNSNLTAGTYMDVPNCASGYTYTTGTFGSYTTYTVEQISNTISVADLSATGTTVEMGSSVSISTTVTYSGSYGPELSWTVSPAGLATLSASSTDTAAASVTLTGVATGTVTVTATSVSDPSVSKSISVTVTEPAPTDPAGDTTGTGVCLNTTPGAIVSTTPASFPEGGNYDSGFSQAMMFDGDEDSQNQYYSDISEETVGATFDLPYTLTKIRTVNGEMTEGYNNTVKSVTVKNQAGDSVILSDAINADSKGISTFAPIANGSTGGGVLVTLVNGSYPDSGYGHTDPNTGNRWYYVHFSEIELYTTQYTVTYDSQGGSDIAPTYKYIGIDSEISSEVPTKRGYRFVGWNTMPDGSGATTYQAGDAYTKDEGRTLYAQWEERPTVYYTVTVNSNGNGTVSGGGSYEEYTDAVITATPAEGYHFVQWDDGSTESTRTVTVTGDKTYTATFAINTYLISFAGNGADGGTVPDAVSVNHGDTYLVPGNTGALTKTGYDFDGWSLSMDGEAVTSLANVTSAQTLYARWKIKTYTVTFMSNGADGGAVPDAVSVNHGVTYALPDNPGALTKAGYIFSGWSLSAGGEAVTQITVTSDLSVFAVWSVSSFTVTYHTNGAESGTAPDSASVASGATHTVSGNTGGLAKGGAVFLGWACTANAAAVEYTAGDLLTVTANVDLYPVWGENQFRVEPDELTTYVGADWNDLGLMDGTLRATFEEYEGYTRTVTVFCKYAWADASKLDANGRLIHTENDVNTLIVSYTVGGHTYTDEVTVRYGYYPLDSAPAGSYATLLNWYNTQTKNGKYKWSWSSANNSGTADSNASAAFQDFIYSKVFDPASLDAPLSEPYAGTKATYKASVALTGNALAEQLVGERGALIHVQGGSADVWLSAESCRDANITYWYSDSAGNTAYMTQSWDDFAAFVSGIGGTATVYSIGQSTDSNACTGIVTFAYFTDDGADGILSAAAVQTDGSRYYAAVPTPVLAGYEFVAWYTARNSNRDFAPIGEDQTYTVAAADTDATVYARFKRATTFEKELFEPYGQSGTNAIRFLMLVDSTQYYRVGFLITMKKALATADAMQIVFAEQTVDDVTYSHVVQSKTAGVVCTAPGDADSVRQKVYRQLQAGSVTVSAASLHPDAQYFHTFTVTGISTAAKQNTDIYVRAFYVALDGSIHYSQAIKAYNYYDMTTSHS